MEKGDDRMLMSLLPPRPIEDVYKNMTDMPISTVSTVCRQQYLHRSNIHYFKLVLVQNTIPEVLFNLQ